jgi:hypothetical protein
MRFVLRSSEASAALAPRWSEATTAEGNGRPSDDNKGEGVVEDCVSVLDAHELSASIMVDKSADNGGQGDMLLSVGANSKY